MDPHLTPLMAPPEWPARLFAGFVSLVVLAFGRGNVGFIILAGLAVGLEYIVKLLSAFLRHDETFDLRQQGRFVLERMLLLILPLTAALVDWLWWFVSPPDLPLGAPPEPNMMMVKAILIPIVFYLLLRSVRSIAYFYKDFPAVGYLMQQLDRLQRGGDPPPAKRRKYDRPQNKRNEEGEQP